MQAVAAWLGLTAITLREIVESLKKLEYLKCKLPTCCHQSESLHVIEQNLTRLAPSWLYSDFIPIVLT